MSMRHRWRGWLAALFLATAALLPLNQAESAGRFLSPITHELDSSGNALAGAQLFFYETGTSTPLDTYSDDSLSTANANPVVADSGGRFGDIFLKDQDYKVVLKTSAGVTIWTADPVRSPEPKATTILNKTTTYTVAAGDDGKLITADASGGAFTITLPAAATAGSGFEVSVIKTDSTSNAVTVDGDGSETINGETSQALAAQFDAIVLRSNGTTWYATTTPKSTTTPLPRGHIDGLEASINSTDSDHDIDIAAGVARDSGDAANLTLSATLTKQIDAAWAVGDGNGGLDTGAVAADTIYYIWLIRRSDTGVTDALFSTSSSSPTMPTNYDQKRLLGQLSTDGSSNIDTLWTREDEAPSVTAEKATTSGASLNFIGIPSWVTQITIGFVNVSTNGTSTVQVRLGDSGGLESTGYAAEAVRIVTAASPTAAAVTTGFGVNIDSASESLNGSIVLTLQDASDNTWTAHGIVAGTGQDRTFLVTGRKSVSAAVDRLGIVTSDVFDSGAISLTYQ